MHSWRCHTPAKMLTETCRFTLHIFDIQLDNHVIVNWHLSKQGICWPVSHDHITGSSLEPDTGFQFLSISYNYMYLKNITKIILESWFLKCTIFNLLSIKHCDYFLTISNVPDFWTNFWSPCGILKTNLLIYNDNKRISIYKIMMFKFQFVLIIPVLASQQLVKV